MDKMIRFILGLVCVSVLLVLAILLRLDPDSVNLLRASWAIFGVTGLLFLGIVTGLGK